VGAAAAVPEGRAVTAVVAGERVAVFRHEGRLSCVSAVCRHQNGPLGEGRIIDGCITCPWHGYQYRPDSGTSPPPFTDTIPTFNLRVHDGRVLVHERPNPPGTPVAPVPAPPAPDAASDAAPFYVGYAPQAPAALARFQRRAVVTILLLAGGLAAALAVAQRGFEAAAFEYGRITTVAGVVRAAPYPLLEVPRPGAPDRVSRYFLAASGKRGAQAAVAGLDGRRVRMRGTLAYRSHLTLLEIAGAEPTDAAPAPAPAEPLQDLGVFDLAGEIVDGKCYMGVMNPGHGKGHRACAARCLSGGLPPLLLVRSESGARLELLLLDGAGKPVTGIERWAGLPLSLRGRVARQGDLWLVHADPRSFRRLQ
jgi:nitrite reductase/ring-hydroxylating ferredoxin subunit